MTEIWKKIYRLWACKVQCICHCLSLSRDKYKWTRMWRYSFANNIWKQHEMTHINYHTKFHYFVRKTLFPRRNYIYSYSIFMNKTKQEKKLHNLLNEFSMCYSAIFHVGYDYCVGYVIEFLIKKTQVLWISFQYCCQDAAVLLQIYDTPPQITAHLSFFQNVLAVRTICIVTLQFLLSSEQNVDHLFL